MKATVFHDAHEFDVKNLKEYESARFWYISAVTVKINIFQHR